MQEIKKSSPSFSERLVPEASRKRPSTRLLILLGALVLLLAGGGLYVWVSIVSKLPSGIEIQEAQRKIHVKPVDWENTVFGHAVFRSLQTVSDPGVDIGENPGNPTPFSRKKTKE